MTKRKKDLYRRKRAKDRKIEILWNFLNSMDIGTVKIKSKKYGELSITAAKNEFVVKTKNE